MSSSRTRAREHSSFPRCSRPDSSSRRRRLRQRSGAARASAARGAGHRDSARVSQMVCTWRSIARWLRRQTILVVTSRYRDPVLTRDAETLGATFVQKPLTAGALLATLVPCVPCGVAGAAGGRPVGRSRCLSGWRRSMNGSNRPFDDGITCAGRTLSQCDAGQQRELPQSPAHDVCSHAHDELLQAPAHEVSPHAQDDGQVSVSVGSGARRTSGSTCKCPGPGRPASRRILWRRRHKCRHPQETAHRSSFVPITSTGSRCALVCTLIPERVSGRSEAETSRE